MSTIDLTRVAGNIGALSALDSLEYINSQLSIHQERLSSGKRINETADDPAGMSLAISMDKSREGLKTVLNAIGDARNLMATMEGGLDKIQDILIKMQSKAQQGEASTLGVAEKSAIREQLQAYIEEIDDLAVQTQWNNTCLLTGTSGSGNTRALTFLTSPEAADATSIFQFRALSSGSQPGHIADFQGFDSLALGLDGALDFTSASSAAVVVNQVNVALTIMKEAISQVGAFSSRLAFKEDAIAVQYTNTEAAYNRIMNADMAAEQVEASKYLILQQTATAMLSQANSNPQSLLSLFN